MLKDEFCTPEPARCVILRGAFCGLAFVSTQGDAADGVTTQVKVVKGLYTEVRNVQHLACVSRVFAPLIGKVMDDKNKKNPLKRMGAFLVRS